MTSVAEDIIQLLADAEIGTRMETLFTSADQGAWDKQPLIAVIHEQPSSVSPMVTVDADRLNLYIDISASYGQNGERKAYEFADRIYRALWLLLDQTVNNHLYYCIKANPPAHLGYDRETGRPTLQIIAEVYRYLGEANNGN